MVVKSGGINRKGMTGRREEKSHSCQKGSGKEMDWVKQNLISNKFTRTTCGKRKKKKKRGETKKRRRRSKAGRKREFLRGGGLLKKHFLNQ